MADGSEHPWLASNEQRCAGFYLGHNYAMRRSPAWRALPDDARRVIDRLEVEHMRQRMKHNGALSVLYDAFVAEAGVRRAAVRLAIEQAAALGFLEVVRRGYAARADVKVPSLYRLTYVKSYKDHPLPTNEWQVIADDRAARTALRRARTSVEEERETKRRRRESKKVAEAVSPELARTL